MVQGPGPRLESSHCAPVHAVVCTNPQGHRLLRGAWAAPRRCRRDETHGGGLRACSYRVFCLLQSLW